MKMVVAMDNNKGRRKGGACRVHYKGGRQDSQSDGQCQQPRMQQSSKFILMVREKGCTVGRGGMRRKFVFIFNRINSKWTKEIKFKKT